MTPSDELFKEVVEALRKLLKHAEASYVDLCEIAKVMGVSDPEFNADAICGARATLAHVEDNSEEQE